MEEYLLIHHHQNLLKEDEKAAVDAWLQSSPENQATYAQCIQIWLHAGHSGALDALDVEGDLEAVNARLGVETSAKRQNGMKWLWRVAAVLVVGAGLAWALMEWQQPVPKAEMLFTESGASTKKMVVLSDGSQVRLNANSRLDYPEAFVGETREVTLSGEAWFKVDADPAHPFVIHHGSSQTEVLGTEFDVRAYPGEPVVSVSVTEGVVRLQSETDAKVAVVLEKGEVGEFEGGKAVRSAVAAKDLNLDAWRTNKLVFLDTPLPIVFEVLERQFDINISVASSSNYENCRFSGSFEAVDKDEAFDMLSTVFNVEITVNGREITILHLNC